MAFLRQCLEAVRAHEIARREAFLSPTKEDGQGFRLRSARVGAAHSIELDFEEFKPEHGLGGAIHVRDRMG